MNYNNSLHEELTVDEQKNIINQLLIGEGYTAFTIANNLSPEEFEKLLFLYHYDYINDYDITSAFEKGEEHIIIFLEEINHMFTMITEEKRTDLFITENEFTMNKNDVSLNSMINNTFNYELSPFLINKRMSMIKKLITKNKGVTIEENDMDFLDILYFNSNEIDKDKYLIDLNKQLTNLTEFQLQIIFKLLMNYKNNLSKITFKSLFKFKPLKDEINERKKNKEEVQLANALQFSKSVNYYHKVLEDISKAMLRLNITEKKNIRISKDNTKYEVYTTQEGEVKTPKTYGDVKENLIETFRRYSPSPNSFFINFPTKNQGIYTFNYNPYDAKNDRVKFIDDNKYSYLIIPVFDNPTRFTMMNNIEMLAMGGVSLYYGAVIIVQDKDTSKLYVSFDLEYIENDIQKKEFELSDNGANILTSKAFDKMETIFNAMNSDTDKDKLKVSEMIDKNGDFKGNKYTIHVTDYTPQEDKISFNFVFKSDENDEKIYSKTDECSINFPPITLKIKTINKPIDYDTKTSTDLEWKVIPNSELKYEEKILETTEKYCRDLQVLNTYNIYYTEDNILILDLIIFELINDIRKYTLSKLKKSFGKNEVKYLGTVIKNEDDYYRTLFSGKMSTDITDVTRYRKLTMIEDGMETLPFKPYILDDTLNIDYSILHKLFD